MNDTLTTLGQPTNEGWMRRLVRAASWLPIENAPRDGTDIIVGFDSASVWIVHVAWWRELEDWMRDDPEWGEEDVGWWSYTKHSVTQEKLEGHRTPTHWMHLPSLPNNQAQARPALPDAECSEQPTK